MALGLTRQQKFSLIAAWLGWAFDGLDGYLYVMVAKPFVARLVMNGRGIAPDAFKAMAADDPVRRAIESDATLKGAIIMAVFLGGWAIGGAVFGRIGDRLGRSRTLTLTILTYALFTGMSCLATRWWHLLIFRFLAALGIGGEWAAGSALVCETLNPRHKAWASATLQSGYQVGCILAALTSGWMAALDPKWVFLVGVTPALLTFWIRWAVPEPQEWKEAAAASRPPPLRVLFSRELIRTTLLSVGLTSIALTTVWSFIYFSPQAIIEMCARTGVAGSVERARVQAAEWEAAVKHLIASVTTVYLIVNIGANFFATYLARLVGYRWAFGLLFGASMAVFLVLFRAAPTPGSVYWIMCAAAFTSLGVFGMFPLYIPPLFPTLVRTLGSGFTYNAGRLISGVGMLYGGSIAAGAGGAHMAIWWTGMLFIPGVLISVFIPRGRDEHSQAGAA
ncbi:MAG TPA: MFS transporter [Phycisphaerales bacterium]|nr:MFS transporter [Phycisphaerales bacterium]